VSYHLTGVQSKKFIVQTTTWSSFMSRIFILVAILFTSTLAFSQAAESQLSPIAQAMVAAINAGKTPEEALADAIAANPESAAELVSAAVVNSSMSGVDAVKVALVAAPEKAAVIAKAAVQAEPASVEAIVEATLANSSAEQAIAVVNAAVNAAPESSQAIITAAVKVQPTMVEDIVVSVAEEVIAVSSQSDNPDSLLGLLDSSGANVDGETKNAVAPAAEVAPVQAAPVQVAAAPQAAPAPAPVFDRALPRPPVEGASPN
jgi:hypothetical protein